MKTVIVDYQSGNLTSAYRATLAVARKGMEVIVSGEAAIIRKADYLILPGVGAFYDCYKNLSTNPEVLEAILTHINEAQRPFFGICVGMQLLADYGEEHGSHKGLGIVGGVVKKLKAYPNLSIPNMGWHPCTLHQDHILHKGLLDGDMGNPWFYFVHSYVFHAKQPAFIAASAHYGEEITAAIARDNLYATQFHPEKSHKYGQILLKNFMEWTP